MIHSQLLYKAGGGIEQTSPAATTESGESGEPGEQLDSGDTGQSSPGINDFHHTMAP